MFALGLSAFLSLKRGVLSLGFDRLLLFSGSLCPPFGAFGASGLVTCAIVFTVANVARLNTKPERAKNMAGETYTTAIGHLTADPELRSTSTGLAVANFTVATTPRLFNRESNDWVDGETLFLRCSVWRDYADNVAATLRKGDQVIAYGRLAQQNYETKEGDKRSAVVLDVEHVGPALRKVRASLVRRTVQTPPGSIPAPVSAPEPSLVGASSWPI